MQPQASGSPSAALRSLQFWRPGGGPTLCPHRSRLFFRRECRDRDGNCRFGSNRGCKCRLRGSASAALPTCPNQDLRVALIGPAECNPFRRAVLTRRASQCECIGFISSATTASTSSRKRSERGTTITRSPKLRRWLLASGASFGIPIALSPTFRRPAETKSSLNSPAREDLR